MTWALPSYDWRGPARPASSVDCTYRDCPRGDAFERRSIILDGHQSAHALRKRWPWVKHLIADGACDQLKLMEKASYLDFAMEHMRRCDKQKGFKIPPRPWVVERTFGWMIRWRRLVRNYEKRMDISHAMILVATAEISYDGTLIPDFPNRL